MISKRFLTTSILDSTKEWITLYSTQIPPKHSSNINLTLNTLDLDSSKLKITLDQQTPPIWWRQILGCLRWSWLNMKQHLQNKRTMQSRASLIEGYDGTKTNFLHNHKSRKTSLFLLVESIAFVRLRRSHAQLSLPSFVPFFDQTSENAKTKGALETVWTSTLKSVLG